MTTAIEIAAVKEMIIQKIFDMIFMMRYKKIGFHVCYCQKNLYNFPGG
jgi:hypothetical protein